MRLYYFTSQKYGLAAIFDQRIKVALHKELNDPFDFIGIATDSFSDRMQVNAVRRRMSEKTGILCMSKKWSEPLLWSHYADSHKGICLTFEVNDDEWRDVKYVRFRPKLSTYNKAKISHLTEADLLDLSHKKFKDWHYENECRMTVPLEETTVENGISFLDFGQHLVLKEVRFGERTSITDAEVHAILTFNEDVKIGFTRSAFRTFSVVMRPKKNAEWNDTGRVIQTKRLRRIVKSPIKK